MLSMARSAPGPGLVVDLPYRWRRERYAPVTDWTADSPAFARALDEAAGRGAQPPATSR
jgi:hypothetical protein